MKNLFLKCSQYSHENICLGASLIKLQPFKKRLQYSCFPVNIAKFLRAPILKNICKQLRKFIQQFGFIRDS